MLDIVHVCVFFFQTAIIKNNPKKYLRSVGDNEEVEFDVVEGEKVGYLCWCVWYCLLPAGQI